MHRAIGRRIDFVGQVTAHPLGRSLRRLSDMIPSVACLPVSLVRQTAQCQREDLAGVRCATRQEVHRLGKCRDVGRRLMWIALVRLSHHPSARISRKATRFGIGKRTGNVQREAIETAAVNPHIDWQARARTRQGARGSPWPASAASRSALGRTGGVSQAPSASPRGARIRSAVGEAKETRQEFEIADTRRHPAPYYQPIPRGGAPPSQKALP